jgi:adenylate cyclase
MAILIGMLCGMFVLRTYDYDWIKSLRFIAFDAYNQIKPRPQTDQVIIVDIDETSLEKESLGQWPWPRDIVADMVSNLEKMGARSIVFDVVFPEEDRTSPRHLAKRLPDYFSDELAKMPDNDETLAKVIRESGNVVTGFVWTSKEEATRRKPALNTSVLMRKEARSLKKTVPEIDGVTTNIPVISNAAAGNGCFGVTSEVDGLIRSVPLLFRMKSKNSEMVRFYPSLAIEALRVAQNPKIPIKIEALRESNSGLLKPPFLMHVGKYQIPLDHDGKMNVYFSKARPEKYIPAWKVIEEKINPEIVSGKIVIVGTSAEGLRDIRSTPLNLFIPGVELHLNIIEQILQEDFLLRPRILEGAELTFLTIIGVMIITLAPFVGAVFLAFFTLVIISSITWASWHGFVTYGLLVDPVFPGISLAVLYVTASLLTYIRTEAERLQIRNAFGLYISPDFMKELTKHPDKLKLGGETRELTVMFTDIRSFTSISEGLTPEELIQLMNDFLTPMSDLVMQNRGTIDKYMGDAMMAFWNAPLDDENHARHACTTALKMNDALAPINERLAERAKERGEEPIVLNAGIGINTGPASIGNMGSRQRFAYSALGDTVNLGSRLEGQTKTYGLTNLIGEKTWRAAPEFATLEIDLIRVKGKQEPVKVFTLTGDPEYAESDEFVLWQSAHSEMISAYRSQNFDQALSLIEKCHEISGGRLETFYEVYRLRIEQMLENLPGPDWDGVYVATTK